ncbi:hypothetical protein CPC08DRAFT_774114 [Agrocybe pediades]|nr:hypothetical protein CPC08DRAFT_774114 [Agrocybe pediades]
MSSRSSSPSSSRSSSPPLQVLPDKKKKKSTTTSSTSTSKDKKKKVKASTAAAGDAKNEGEDLNWAYAPPPGAVLLGKEDVDAGDFDWDRINNDENLELWLIRVPDSVKPKYLENIKIDVPSSSSKSALVGNVKRKHTSYDIWSVGDDNDNNDDEDNNNSTVPIIGGEEIKNLTCLLPRTSKKGRLYPAPKPISRHLIISVPPVTPSSEAAVGASQLKNPPRPVYPPEVLKHRYVPFGANIKPAPTTTASNAMDVDVDVDADAEAELAQPAPPPSPKKKSKKSAAAATVVEETEEPADAKKSKGKKRKGEAADVAETPAKKSKKTKVA